MAITPKAPGVVGAPNTIPNEAALPVAIPNILTSEAAGTVAIPNTLPAKAKIDVAIPNVIPNKAVIPVAIPNVLTAETAGAVAIPNVLTPLAASVFPRTLTPISSFDFKCECYSQGNESKAFDDIITFSRSTIGTFVNRVLNNLNKYDYFIDTVAIDKHRIEYDPETGETLGILIEDTSTNLALRSEEFDNASWSKTASSVTLDSIISPDLTLNADKLVEDSTAASQHAINQQIAYTIGNLYTFSIFVKADTISQVALSLGSGAFGVTVRYDFLDFESGVATEITPGTNSSGEIKKIGNGWFRCSITAEATITASTAASLFLIKAGSLTYNGDGVSGLFIWGAQVELFSKKSSYIKTTSSTVTRAADNVTADYLNLPRFTSPWSLTMDISNVNSGDNYTMLGLTDPERLTIAMGSLFLQGNGDSKTFKSGLTGNENMALSSDGVNISGYVDGVFEDVGIVTLTNITSGSFALGKRSINLQYLNGHIGGLFMYDVQLTADEVSRLTGV